MSFVDQNQPLTPRESNQRAKSVKSNLSGKKMGPTSPSGFMTQRFDKKTSFVTQIKRQIGNTIDMVSIHPHLFRILRLLVDQVHEYDSIQSKDSQILGRYLCEETLVYWQHYQYWSVKHKK